MRAIAVEGDATDRGPGLGQDAVLGIEGLYLALLEVRVQLDLVDGRHNRGRLQQIGEVPDHAEKAPTPMARTLPCSSSVSRAR